MRRLNDEVDVETVAGAEAADPGAGGLFRLCSASAVWVPYGSERITTVEGAVALRLAQVVSFRTPKEAAKAEAEFRERLAAYPPLPCTRRLEGPALSGSQRFCSGDNHCGCAREVKS